VNGLRGNTTADKSTVGGHVLGFDEDNNFVIHGGIDDELTDADAEGETDPEFDQDTNEPMDIDGSYVNKSNDASQKISRHSSVDSEEDDFEDPYIVPVAGRKLPLTTDRHFLDELDGR
jgi:hypothetical protein